MVMGKKKGGKNKNSSLSSLRYSPSPSESLLELVIFEKTRSLFRLERENTKGHKKWLFAIFSLSRSQAARRVLADDQRLFPNTARMRANDCVRAILAGIVVNCAFDAEMFGVETRSVMTEMRDLLLSAIRNTLVPDVHREVVHVESLLALVRVSKTECALQRTRCDGIPNVSIRTRLLVGNPTAERGDSLVHHEGVVGLLGVGVIDGGDGHDFFSRKKINFAGFFWRPFPYFFPKIVFFSKQGKETIRMRRDGRGLVREM